MTKESLRNILGNLKKETDKYSNSFAPHIKDYIDNLKELSAIIIKIEESWSGSWIGFHSNLYYIGFKKPKWDESFDAEWGSLHGIPESWRENSYDEISSYINTIYQGKDISCIQDFLNQQVEYTKELQQNINTELSLIRSFKNFDKEIEILDKLESIKWGTSQRKFIDVWKPKQHITRDSFAMHQGIKIPPHIEYRSNVFYFLSVISDIENFIKLSQRLIRQIEIRENFTSEGETVLESISNVLNICKRFHNVARQLRNRYNKRSTLEIEDEYDVQDLLHSLLKIHFDDIRPEEWVPSYAGSSSIMDFLLKNENLIIEVKKTRKELTDKKIGEQLLIDIAKYKQHPDCKTLICFIYDPEWRIGNPRGLENDLNQLSNDDINIITIIEPS